MTPTEQLKEEHGGVKVMLRIIGKICDRMESGKVEEERVGHGRHEAFHALMDRLRGEYGA